MTANFARVFGATKPVIGMVHIGALPGSPLHDPGVDLLAAARADLRALQDAGFDAVMFGNENDRPYEFQVDTASVATMAHLIGQLRAEITVPFGVNVLWDPMATVALGAATGAQFVREIFTGTYASDMGLLSSGGRPHALSWSLGHMMGASLDHAMWFHGALKIDEWHLYAMDAPFTGGARAFNRGSIYTRDGRLAVSVAQEGLMRPIKPKGE